MLSSLGGNQRKDSMEDILKRRNFKWASRCSICFVQEESVHHLFIHCRWVSTLYHLSLSLMAISWVQSQTTRDVLVAEKKVKEELGLSSLQLMPLAIWWRP